jgi:hypothetical protein
MTRQDLVLVYERCTPRQTHCPKVERLPVPPRHAVAIEPGLRRQSAENGNICSGGRRFSANSTLCPHIWECRDRSPGCKSPPLVAISATIPSVFSGLGTAWLALQCRSHPSPRDFPAIREFNREFCNSEAFGDGFGARNRCAAATYRAIPYSI